MLLAGAAGASEDAGRFEAAAQAPPAPWEIVRFDSDVPPTRYRIVDWDGVVGIEARAKASMALLARPLTVDLQRTPILCWRWRIDAPLKSADMRRKSGDDYAARVYIAMRLPPGDLGFATRAKLALARRLFGAQVPDAALNYIWDNTHSVGTRRANAYTDRTQMIVARSGAGEAGHWVSERHDVLADARMAFGSTKPSATLLAVAADTDNTGESARAGFADLHFVAPDAACQFSAARPDSSSN